MSTPFSIRGTLRDDPIPLTPEYSLALFRLAADRDRHPTATQHLLFIFVPLPTPDSPLPPYRFADTVEILGRVLLHKSVPQTDGTTEEQFVILAEQLTGIPDEALDPPPPADTPAIPAAPTPVSPEPPPPPTVPGPDVAPPATPFPAQTQLLLL